MTFSACDRAIGSIVGLEALSVLSEPLPEALLAYIAPTISCADTPRSSTVRTLT